MLLRRKRAARISVEAFAGLFRLPAQRLEALKTAGDEFYALINDFHRTASHPVGELLASVGADFATFTPIPADGVGSHRDSYAWYYHAHDPSPDRPWREHGHFHCFALVEGRFDEPPWASSPNARPDRRVAAHLVALCIDEAGLPNRLFTLNRWASDETLYRAHHLIPLVEAFAIHHDQRFLSTSRWLGATLKLLAPSIAELLNERDAILEARAQDDPQGFCEDPSLEITSMLRFELENYLEALDQALRVCNETA